MERPSFRYGGPLMAENEVARIADMQEWVYSKNLRNSLFPPASFVCRGLSPFSRSFFACTHPTCVPALFSTPSLGGEFRFDGGDHCHPLPKRDCKLARRKKRGSGRAVMINPSGKSRGRCTFSLAGDRCV